MRGIWAIARQTYAQCLRMKVAVGFIILLGAGLVAMPLMTSGDGTLAGRVRSFLEYSSAYVAMLLTLVTVFLSVAVVSNDVRDKQILTLATKPLPRWQYIVGRWVGVVLLNLLLLAISGAGIYAFSQYLRNQPARSSEDRRIIETEIFAARQRVAPPSLEGMVTQRLGERVSQMREAGNFEPTRQQYITEAGGDRARGEVEMERDLRQQILQGLQSTGPGQTLQWDFTGIRASGEPLRGEGVVEAAGTDGTGQAPRLRVQAPASLVGRLVYDGPVQIDGTEGRVIRVEQEAFHVQFDPRSAHIRQIQRIEEGSRVEIAIEPTIQLSYKAQPSSSPPDALLHSLWRIENPTTGDYYFTLREDPVEMQVTLTLPARVVDDTGNLRVVYTNLPNPNTGFASSVLIPHEEISVMYRVGGFETNFLRGMGLILVRVMFVAAIGVVAGSLLSFPVGVVACLSILPWGLAQEFISDAFRTAAYVGTDPISWVGQYMFAVMRVLLPDLGALSPSGFLLDGEYISWAMLGQAMVLTLGVRVVLALGLGSLIFYRRELAGVQV